MTGQPEGDKVKRLIRIFEHGDKLSKRCKTSSDVAVNSGRVKENILCDPCEFGNTEKEADGFCKTCLEYLCSRCVKEHLKAKQTREHALITNDIPKDAEVLRRMKNALFCPEHSNTTIAYYCNEHDKDICYLCKEKCHRQCKTSPLISSSTSSTDEITKLFEKMQTLREKVRSVKDQKKKHIESLLREKYEIQEKQHNYLQELTEKITENMMKAKAEAEKITGTIEKDVKKEVKQCDEIEGDNMRQKEMLETAMRTCSGDNLVLITRPIERKVKALEINTMHLEQKENNKLLFSTNAALLDDISLGTLTVVGGENDTSKEHVDVSSDEVHEMAQCSVAAARVSNIPRADNRLPANYNIRLGDDSAICSVLEIINFPDGRLVLFDMNNTKLKLFTKNFEFVCAESVEDIPSGISYLGKDLLATATGHGKSTQINIYFVGVQSIYLHDTCTFKIDLFCRGIAFYREQVVAAIMTDVDSEYTTRADDEVEIHFFNCQTMSCTKIIKYFESIGGRELWFRDPIGISFANRDVMLIMEPNIIHCFDLHTDQNGENIAEQRWYYRLDDACYITNVGKSAFVCERGGCVHQIALDNYRNNRVIISDIETPLSVSIDERRARIVVGYEENDFIEVLNFRYSGRSDWVSIVP